MGDVSRRIIVATPTVLTRLVIFSPSQHSIVSIDSRGGIMFAKKWKNAPDEAELTVPPPFAPTQSGGFLPAAEYTRCQ